MVVPLSVAPPHSRYVYPLLCLYPTGFTLCSSPLRSEVFLFAFSGCRYMSCVSNYKYQCCLFFFAVTRRGEFLEHKEHIQESLMLTCTPFPAIVNDMAQFQREHPWCQRRVLSLTLKYLFVSLLGVWVKSSRWWGGGKLSIMLSNNGTTDQKSGGFNYDFKTW